MVSYCWPKLKKIDFYQVSANFENCFYAKYEYQIVYSTCERNHNRWNRIDHFTGRKDRTDWLVQLVISSFDPIVFTVPRQTTSLWNSGYHWLQISCRSRYIIKSCLNILTINVHDYCDKRFNNPKVRTWNERTTSMRPPFCSYGRHTFVVLVGLL